MKSFVVIFVALVVIETSYAQCLRAASPSIISGLGGCGCGIGSYGCGLDGCGCGISSYGCGLGGCGCGVPAVAPIITSPATIPATIMQSNSVAASLADTLSLLTVSSLLAETLPLGPNIVSVAPSCGCGYGGIGMGGLGCGCGGCGGYYY